MAEDQAWVAELVRQLTARFAAVNEEKAQTTAGARSSSGRAARSKGSPARADTPTDEEAAAARLTQRNRRHWVAVCYDIPDDRRRTKVMKTLEGFGRRVQYSVFECVLRPADLEKLKARLKALIQPEQDDIRFYDLCETCQGKVITLGRAQMHREQPSVMV